MFLFLHYPDLQNMFIQQEGLFKTPIYVSDGLKV